MSKLEYLDLSLSYIDELPIDDSIAYSIANVITNLEYLEELKLNFCSSLITKKGMNKINSVIKDSKSLRKFEILL